LKDRFESHAAFEVAEKFAELGRSITLFRDWYDNVARKAGEHRQQILQELVMMSLMPLFVNQYSHE
jgi:hypothetical protein